MSSLSQEYRKSRDELRLRRKGIDADIKERRESLMSALSLTRPNAALQGDYIVSLAISLNELLVELHGVDEQINILSRELEA